MAPGVLVRAAGISAAPVAAAPPRGNFGAWALTGIVAAVALLLAGVGSGWAAALLPSDPLVRVSLSPALGGATVTLVAVMWDRVGLGFSTVQAWCLVSLTAAAGWAVAVGVRRRAGRSTPSRDDAGEATPL